MVSATTQLKFIAADGKKYVTDTLDSDGVIALAKHFPYKRHKTVITLFKSTLKFLLCKFKGFYCADLRIFIVQKKLYQVRSTKYQVWSRILILKILCTCLPAVGRPARLPTVGRPWWVLATRYFFQVVNNF